MCPECTFVEIPAQTIWQTTVAIPSGKRACYKPVWTKGDDDDDDDDGDVLGAAVFVEGTVRLVLDDTEGPSDVYVSLYGRTGKTLLGHPVPALSFRDQIQVC